MPDRSVADDSAHLAAGSRPRWSQAAILTVLNTQTAALAEQMQANFGEHPDVEAYLSQPGLGLMLGSTLEVLAEFGDDQQRYPDAKARKNYGGTSPITRQSGKHKVMLARRVPNDRLLDAVGLQPFCALGVSPGGAHYDRRSGDFGRPAVGNRPKRTARSRNRLGLN